MSNVIRIPKISLLEFEKLHASRKVVPFKRPTVREVFVTVALIVVMAPFFFVTASVIPIMGPVTVLLALGVSSLYLVYRRSWFIAGVSLLAAVAFWALIFATIQSVKNDLDIFLFVLTALGIPLSFIFTGFVATQIWILRGGVE